MGVRVDHVLQLKAKLFQRGQVSLLLLEHWVNKHSLLCRGAAKDVGEGRRLGVEELPEDEALLARRARSRSILRRKLRQQPLLHGATARALRPELQVQVRGQHIGRLARVASMLRQPEQQCSAHTHAGAALQHQRPRQPLQGGDHGFGLLVRGHGGRPREGSDRDLHAGRLELLKVEVRVVGAVEVDPSLVPAGERRDILGSEVSAEADVAGHGGHLDAQALDRHLHALRRGVVLGAVEAALHDHGLGEQVVHLRVAHV
mmetsp:Transcript_81549/g.215132  ORF Transcript_81549/g.215132 Transcript_81549/m.215132 type:complete len:259 (-) Transcript_81549:66-842(-)